MPEDVDDETATEVGHALVRWITNEDPGGVANFLPDFVPSDVDDAKAARIGSSVIELLQHLDTA
jgi:hypothetical protein